MATYAMEYGNRLLQNMKPTQTNAKAGAYKFEMSFRVMMLYRLLQKSFKKAAPTAVKNARSTSHVFVVVSNCKSQTVVKKDSQDSCIESVY